MVGHRLMGFKWTLDRLPFVWAPLSQPFADSFPAAMPFSLGVDGPTGRIVQLPDPKVEEVIEAAYAKGSMLAGRMDEQGLGRRYADDFIEFIGREGGDVAGSRVLEIGSGTGYLLSRLKEMEADTVGVEPGAHGQERFEEPGVELLRDFFPSPQIEGEFDLIVMFCVLEHVAELDTWFEEIHRLLRPQGRLVISVPACEPYLSSGDLSILVHEHYSYFTETTLKDTLAMAGFGQSKIEEGLGGFLSCVAAVGNGGVSPDPEQAQELARRFQELAQEAVVRLRGFLTETRQEGQSVAVYVPMRVLNFIALGEAPVDHCRFFDDDPLQQGRYLPGIDVVVEDQDALVRDPTDHVLIMSRTFGSDIRERLARELPKATRFTTVEELLGH